MGAERDDERSVEPELRALCDAGRHDEAVTRLLRAYGAELYGFLLAMHRGDVGAAGDVFSAVGERLWRGLPGFHWRSTARGWAYVVARNASLDHLRGEARRRHEPLTSSVASELAAAARTATRTMDRTDARDAVAHLRDQLAPDDRALLVLRLDRGLAWDELARVFLAVDAPADAAVKREAARLRKRYQLVKQRLARAARELGLVRRDA